MKKGIFEVQFCVLETYQYSDVNSEMPLTGRKIAAKPQMGSTREQWFPVGPRESGSVVFFWRGDVGGSGHLGFTSLVELWKTLLSMRSRLID